MPLDNIDDLFRGKLDGHETPPSDDLWARLAAQPAAEPTASASAPAEAPGTERLDQLFQSRLNSHISPPARELWERLEDEYLRPGKRRAAAWWPLALAAAIALLITAGGTGLWLGFPGGKTSGTDVAGQSGKGASTVAGTTARDVAATAPINAASTASINKETTEVPQAASESRAALAANTVAEASQKAIFEPAQKKAATRATGPVAVASTASKARKFAERQSPRHPLGSTRQPDVAAPSPSLVARTTPAVAPAPNRNAPADEQHPAPVAQTATPVPAPEIVPASTVITVDVRNGATPASRSIRTALSEVASVEETTERRGLGGRLLQQAGHLVRGERLSLAEATGLPENVTLRANIAGRRVSKSIQL